MTDYRAISDTEIDPDAPVTSELAYALRDNPIAIAEGAGGAPRVMGLALDIYLGALSINGQTPLGFTGMDRVSWIVGSFAFTYGTGSGAKIIQVRYSSDSGSTFGSWQNLIIISSSSGSTSGSVIPSGQVRLNLRTGQYVYTGSQYAGLLVGSGTNTVPAGCNAVQFRSDSNGHTGQLDFEIHGGAA